MFYIIIIILFHWINIFDAIIVISVVSVTATLETSTLSDCEKNIVKNKKQIEAFPIKINLINGGKWMAIPMESVINIYEVCWNYHGINDCWKNQLFWLLKYLINQFSYAHLCSFAHYVYLFHCNHHYKHNKLLSPFFIYWGIFSKLLNLKK